MFVIFVYQKVPAARVIASPSEAAKEDNAQRKYQFVGTLTNNRAGMAEMLQVMDGTSDIGDYVNSVLDVLTFYM